MARESFDDLVGFLTVAQERSFTRAAAKLGVTPSALSHSIMAVERRLGVRLLNRTTRSVNASEAGERLLMTVAPRFEEIEGDSPACAKQGTGPPERFALAPSTTPSTDCCGRSSSLSCAPIPTSMSR